MATILCRGRNGWFRYADRHVNVAPGGHDDPPDSFTARVALYSSRTPGTCAPVVIRGTVEDIKELLLAIVSDIEQKEALERSIKEKAGARK